MNEEDIIEAMVRHHAALVDHHLFLDNGSVDRTLEILAALRAEGIPLTVLQNSAVMFSEVQFNTMLYTAAVRELGADWVLFLDSDEFVDTRSIADLRGLLAAVPAEHQSLGVQLINYDAPTEATRHELNVVQRFVRRTPAPVGVWKVFARGVKDVAGITIGAGNHYMEMNGAEMPPPLQHAFVLAHYPNRSPLQWACKAVTGWLKVLASGQAELQKGRSSHYQPSFEQLKADPRPWIEAALQAGVPPPSPELVEDPIVYLGKPLLYTEGVDYGWRGLSLLLASVERLAVSHGALLDRTPAARRKAESELHRMHPVLGAASPDVPPAGYGALVTSVWREACDPSFRALLGDDWSHSEDWGVWGVGPVHVLRLLFPIQPKHTVKIEVFAQVPLMGTRMSQAVDVCVSGRTLATWHFTPETNGGMREVLVPASLVGKMLRMEFRPHSVASPADLDPSSTDHRLLGLGLLRLRSLLSQ